MIIGRNGVSPGAETFVARTPMSWKGSCGQSNDIIHRFYKMSWYWPTGLAHMDFPRVVNFNKIQIW